MNSIDYGFNDNNYDVILSNNAWGDSDPVTLAQVDTMEDKLNFTNPNAMFKLAIHDIDLSGTNPDFIHNFNMTSILLQKILE